MKFTGDNSETNSSRGFGERGASAICSMKSGLRAKTRNWRDEVTELARKYSIVTPYTAYLIMEDEGRRNVPTSMRSFAAARSGSCCARGSGQKTGIPSKQKIQGKRHWQVPIWIALKSAQAPARRDCHGRSNLNEHWIV